MGGPERWGKSILSRVPERAQRKFSKSKLTEPAFKGEAAESKLSARQAREQVSWSCTRRRPENSLAPGISFGDILPLAKMPMYVMRSTVRSGYNVRPRRELKGPFLLVSSYISVECLIGLGLKRGQFAVQ
ncbi:hypothetical protein KFL_005050100 [Klebsormidium nitens]|uniref:Uncharacterized protein n=1 Tax=Klebsormidium nitens TaxID=105231 RepID=A0A1Y1IF76_KLENI|nr:hypothetical protein KFL_005050100 [Klebsormidium nitens]|eukprot:GAQ89273.1 hypothetical protein KFL_005050100 [Klebsormidium nitens]